MNRVMVVAIAFLSACSACAHKQAPSMISLESVCNHIGAMKLAKFKAEGGEVDSDILLQDATFRGMCKEFLAEGQHRYPVWFQEFAACVMGSRVEDEALLCAKDFDAKIEAGKATITYL